VPDLGRACDIVALCMPDDSDVREILEDRGLLASRPTSGIIVNHATERSCGSARDRSVVALEFPCNR
jgi:3-hydroxyisobutyrate dehydrogenase-like beta-hydroxyacid dehydrogenase